MRACGVVGWMCTHRSSATLFLFQGMYKALLYLQLQPTTNTQCLNRC